MDSKSDRSQASSKKAIPTTSHCPVQEGLLRGKRAINPYSFNFRHNIVLRKIKDLIEQNQLGKLLLIENREFYSGGRTYMSRWNRFRSNSGGLWIHKGSHDFDVFNWLFNFPRPLRVSAVAANNTFIQNKLPLKVKPGAEIGPTCHACAYKDVCPDAHLLWLNYQPGFWDENAAREDNYYKDLCMYNSEKDIHDNGIAIIEYEGGIKASHLECFVSSPALDDRKYTIIGTLGTIEASIAKRQVSLYPRWSEAVTTWQLPEEKEGHGGADLNLLNAFLQAISGEKRIPRHSSMD